MAFRKDINGLRAIAVIAVVLFHFNPSWLSGGFAGVDVFFVISGFLMTGIIFRGIEQDGFSILRFYVARANRIIPALAVLCFALLIFGWFYLTPLDYKTLGKHAVGSIGFISNILYWRESGYFDASSLEKWLLHTWSLSVEWQFYIIYPLVLVAVRKVFSKQAMKVVVLVGTVISFAICVVATYKWPTAAYYLLPTRAWEMMIGGVAYLYPIKANEKYKRLLELVGVVFILGSYFLSSATTPWPGYIALFPVLGSFLIIQAQRNNSFITANMFFQKIGQWSYSIYLWHWPLVVAIYWYSLDSVFIYLGIFFSTFLGFLSYKYIEKIRFRNDFFCFKQIFKCKPLYIAVVVGFVGFVGFWSNGFEFRFSDEVQNKNRKAMAADGDWEYPKANIKIEGKDIRLMKGESSKNILFIGASHIEQTYPYVQSLNSNYNIYFLTKGGCFISPSYQHPKWDCSAIQDYKSIINSIRFDKIVTSFYLFDKNLSLDGEVSNEQIDSRISEYDEFLNFAKEHSNKVFVILGEPTGDEFDPKLSVRYDLKNFIPVKKVREQYKIHYDALNKLGELDGVMVIDPVNYLCDDICLVSDGNSDFYYKDRDHMRPWYAKKSLGYLDEIFK